MKKYSIVIDTGILVTALKSNRGASFKILLLMPSDKFEFHLSVPLKVLTPKEFLQEIGEAK